MADLFSAAQPTQPRYGKNNPRPLSAAVPSSMARRCEHPGCGSWAVFGCDDTWWCGPHSPDATWRHVVGGRPPHLTRQTEGESAR